jgi:hypothetical protein
LTLQLFLGQHITLMTISGTVGCSTAWAYCYFMPSLIVDVCVKARAQRLLFGNRCFCLYLSSSSEGTIQLWNLPNIQLVVKLLDRLFGKCTHSKFLVDTGQILALLFPLFLRYVLSCQAFSESGFFLPLFVVIHGK